MGFGGAIIGGIIGGIFGGGRGVAIGAVIGYVIGDSIGRRGYGDAEKTSSVDPKEFAENSERLEFEMWETLFRAFGKLAKSDGVVSREEADLVGAFLRQTGLPSPLRKQLIAAFNDGKKSDKPFRTMLRAVANAFSRADYPRLMTAFGDIVLADGKIDARELAMLREAEAVLEQHGFVDRWLENVRGGERRTRGERKKQPPPEQNPPHALSWAYQLLGVPPGCSDDEVKKAWRTKAKEYHPDILRGKGVEESVVRLAEEQMRRVNDAYEQIKKARGI